MRRIGTALASIVMAALLTGCLGGEGEADGGEDTTKVPPSSDGPGASLGPVKTTPEGVSYRMFNASGHITADAAYLGADPTASLETAQAHVPEGAIEIVAELRWTGPASEFDLVALSPRFCPDAGFPTGTAQALACFGQYYATKDSDGAYQAERAVPLMGPSELRLELDAATIAADGCSQDPCTWTIVAWWEAAVDTDYEIRATVFLDGAAPDGYTAFEA